LLRARRLVERNLRFIHVVTGHVDVDDESQDWDAHRDLEKNHGLNARTVDKPIAGLLADLAAARAAGFDLGGVDLGVWQDFLWTVRQRPRS
jgi:hypothetical protein